MDKEKLIAEIGKKRYQHSVRVAETAKALAKKWHEDEDKAYLAGLYHDCAKYKDKAREKEKIEQYDFQLNDDMKASHQLIHSPLGKVIAREEYGIEDEEVLNAIDHHTTGTPTMTDLDKIVFIADYIEPKRDFPGVDKARELAKEDLNLAMEWALRQTLANLKRQDLPVAEITRETLAHIEQENKR